MKKSEDTEILDASGEAITSVLGDDSPKIYTHAVFAQCVLPVRALPKEVSFYEVKHGNASLMIQSGVLWDDRGNPVKMEVPAGPKARILFPYIIDHVVRNDSPHVDMGNTMYQFMLDNDIKVGGANRKELQRQINNIAASSVNLGLFGETETHRYGHQRTYRVASDVSFWHEKDANQLTFWNPTLTISDELMGSLEKHRILLNLDPLLKLQSSPRAMDMYMWLSYRMHSVKRPIKISFRDLHAIFGKGSKSLGAFKQDFVKALEMAGEYLDDVNIDTKSDNKHLILSNKKYLVHVPAVSGKHDMPIEEGIFGELKSFGIQKKTIEELAQGRKPEDIAKALEFTKSSIESGKVKKNAAGYLIEAIKGGWAESKVSDVKKGDDANSKKPELDQEYEDKITDPIWKRIRAELLKTYGIATFNSWLKELEYVIAENSGDKAEVVLYTKTQFAADWVSNHYTRRLEAMWQKHNPEIKRVLIVSKTKK